MYMCMYGPCFEKTNIVIVRDTLLLFIFSVTKTNHDLYNTSLRCLCCKVLQDLPEAKQWFGFPQYENIDYRSWNDSHHSPKSHFVFESEN